MSVINWNQTKKCIVFKILFDYLLLIIPTLGIDVSHWNKNIDWTKFAKTSIKFASAKATEGSLICDQLLFGIGMESEIMVWLLAPIISLKVMFQLEISWIIQEKKNTNKLDINSIKEKYLTLDFEENAAKLKLWQMATILYSLKQLIEFANKYRLNNYRLRIANYHIITPMIHELWKWLLCMAAELWKRYWNFRTCQS